MGVLAFVYLPAFYVFKAAAFNPACAGLVRSVFRQWV
jgi:hypothetical protein